MKKLSFQKSYNPHVLQVLEFDLVRKIVSSFAYSEEGSSGVSEITPSKDAEIVRALLAEAGEIVGIDVLDHIIIGAQKYLSLKREGLF